MRIILHPSRCPNSVLRACALRLFAGVGPPLRALFCCPAAPGGWNPGAKTGGTLLSRPFFGGCAGGAPDLSAAMTRPCLRDAGTYDFRTKWFLIFFKKNRNPLFFCRPADRRPATLPPCHFAVLPLCRPATLPSCHFAVLPLCRPATLPSCYFAALPPCHFAALPLCRPATLPPCRPPSCRPPSCRPLPCSLPPAALPPCRPAALPPATRCPADSPERRMPFPRPPLGPGKIRLR